MLGETNADESIPPSLLEFISMIEHGADIKSQMKHGASQSDISIAQLLQFNCFAKYKEDATSHRHRQARETPFAVYVGLSVYSRTRRSLIGSRSIRTSLPEQHTAKHRHTITSYPQKIFLTLTLPTAPKLPIHSTTRYPTNIHTLKTQILKYTHPPLFLLLIWRSL